MGAPVHLDCDMADLRALIVEDDIDFLDLLVEAIAARPGWRRPSRALDGVHAMALLGDGEVPNLVVLDLELPRLHGIEVLQHLRRDSRFRSTAVVVTGAGGDPGRDRKEFLPGEVWLPKPFDLEDLEIAVRIAQAGIAASAEPAPARSPGATDPGGATRARG